MVVDEGVAIGFGMVGLLNPRLGLQMYDEPPVANNCVFSPSQILTSVPALAAKEFPTTICKQSVSVHPVLSVTVTQ